MKLTLKLNRRVYSKKNSKRFIIRGAKKFFIPSAAFERFQNEAIADIYEQMGWATPQYYPYFTGLVRVHTDFFIPGRTRVDGDNLHTSILDVLEKANVIADDNNVFEGSYKKHPLSRKWGADIIIEKL